MTVQRVSAGDVPERPGGDQGHLVSAISDRVVRLHKEIFGKGPENARTYHAGDLIVVLLREPFTGLERTLQQAGRTQAVDEQRLATYELAKERLTAAVEELTGRRVTTFTSSMHHEPDLVANLFLLAPKDEAEDARPA